MHPLRFPAPANQQRQDMRIAASALGPAGASCIDRHTQTTTPLVDRLAHGYFSRHPLQGMAVLFVAFVVACSVAPAFELLSEGL